MKNNYIQTKNILQALTSKRNYKILKSEADKKIHLFFCHEKKLNGAFIKWKKKYFRNQKKKNIFDVIYKYGKH